MSLFASYPTEHIWTLLLQWFSDKHKYQEHPTGLFFLTCLKLHKICWDEKKTQFCNVVINIIFENSVPFLPVS